MGYKLLCKLSLLSLLFYAGEKFASAQTDGFILFHIRSSLAFNKEWETSPLNEKEQQELLIALEKPFSYLGSGGQCYAFASDTHVIKFFKHHRRSSFLTIQEKKRRKKEAKFLRDFTSYKLSFENLREETGLLFVHLNKTDTLCKKITIIDKIGIAHTLSLDEYEFVVQKRGTLAHIHLDTLMQKGDVECAKRSIDSLLGILKQRCQKGIFDEDAKIHRNVAFIEEKAVLIDVGRFRKDPSRKNPEVYKKDIRMITKRLKAFLVKYPELDAYLEKKVDELD